MAEKQKDPARVLLKNVRLSYPAIFKAKPFGGEGDSQGEPKFSAAALMDPETKIGQRNIEKLEDAIAYVKEKTWPKGAPKLAAAKICLKDSEDLEEMKDGYEGMMYVTASNAKRPRVLDIDGQDVREGDEGAPYAGCYVDMIVRVWGQDNKYGKRINASLEGIKFRDDGDAFGAAPISDDDFEDDDDDAPKSRGKSAPKGRGRGDDNDEDKPHSRRGRGDDGEDDAPPRRRGRGDDNDEDKPRSRRGRGDDGEDDAPPRRRGRDDDGDDDAPPRRRGRDDDGDEDKPRSRRGRGDDGEDDAPPRRRGRDDDGDDDPPRRRRSRDNDMA